MRYYICSLCMRILLAEYVANGCISSIANLFLSLYDRSLNDKKTKIRRCRGCVLSLSTHSLASLCVKGAPETIVQT